MILSFYKEFQTINDTRKHFFNCKEKEELEHIM